MPIRIVIFTVGTEGDARPYAALGKGLANEGHDVVIATSREFETFVRAHGLGFAPLTADFLALMRRHRHVMDDSRQVKLVHTLIGELRRWARTWAAEGLEAGRDADLIIGSGNVALLAASVAERYDVPFIQSQLQPFHPSRALPPPLFRPPALPLPGLANLLFYKVLRILTWRLMRDAANDVRRALDLADYPRSGPWKITKAAGGRILYGFSQHLVPRQREWPKRISMPGHFLLKRAADYAPPAELEAFLAAGPPPIYVGFGSMVSGRAEIISAIVGEAIRLLERRAVVSRGWAGLGENSLPSARILMIDGIPHDWLFRRVALAVHHCGAGTTAASAAAGVPVVPVPFVGDQFFWAWRLARLGVATRRLDHRTLTAHRLADAIRRAEAPEMRRKAALLGALVRAEDGVGNAVRQLDQWGVLSAVQPRRSGTELVPV